LDLLVAGAVEELPLATPPMSPVLGASYIVAEGATDAWAGKSQCVAGWTSGGWRFVAAVEGMSLFVRSTSTWAVFRGGAWETGLLRGDALVIGGEQVIGARAPRPARLPTRPEARRSITRRGPPLAQFSARCESTASSKSKKSSRLKNFAECMLAD
jgi:Protein of unknown function (DUF2793)